MQFINQLCQQLNEIKDYLNKRESTTSFYVEGAFGDACELINSIAEFAISEANFLNDHVALFIDGQRINLMDFPDFYSNNRFPAEYQLTVDTKDLVQSYYSGSGDIDEYLFTSIESFKHNCSELGLDKPLVKGKLAKSRNTRIHVFGLQDAFGGPRLAVVPILDNAEDDRDWLTGTTLPERERLLKQVHIVSNENIQLDPRNVQLSWGNFSQELARPFRIAYAQHLLVSLSCVFYSVEKVHFKGVKHIDASVVCADGVDVTTDWLKTMQESVVWCYSIEDSEIPIQLFTDRLSLESHDNCMFNLSKTALENCLEQAKSNYKYVVAKRSDDYRKELKEIYSDIKTVTDKFADKAASLSGELLKSLMAIGFMFTVGTMSKAIVQEQLLHTRESHFLFQAIAIYLIVSFLIRWLSASTELRIAERALKSWSQKLHNHLSTDEVNELIKSQTMSSKRLYGVSLWVVALIQGSFVVAAFNIEKVLCFLQL